MFVLLEKIPRWISSATVLAAILWITLSPAPAGDVRIQLFEGADKVVHTIMFAMLGFVLLNDLSKKSCGNKIMYGIIAAAISSGIGITTEILQKYMDLGRGFEYSDIAADITGSVSGAAISLFPCPLQKKDRNGKH